MKFNGKFCWIVWQVNCPIISKSKEELELILQEHEQKLIPEFKENLEEYAKFMPLLNKYQFKILREIKYS